MPAVQRSRQVYSVLNAGKSAPLVRALVTMKPSNSQLDVLDVAPQQLVPKALKAIKSRRASNSTITSDPYIEQECAAIQEHENEQAEVVVVCEPEGTSLMMGGLHPRASLYERPVNLESAKKAHSEFRRVMREHGIKVLTVRDILKYGVSDHMGARVDLEELAMKALKYSMAEGFTHADLNEQDCHYVSEEYKKEVLEHMSIHQLIDTILINPTVHISPSYRDTGLSASYTFKPLSNLVYTRDQQITTCRGVVSGRLRSQQRQLEVELMRFCFRKLGLPVVGVIEPPGYLEGGDFFPAGRDLALVGIGLRSNFEACHQLMERDMLGTRRLAVVKDQFEQHQDRMHLDCVFSILGDECCLMMEEMMGEDSQTKRLVDEWTRDDATGGYNLTRQNVEFSEFMRGEGYSIVPIKAEHQLKYGCNILNLGNSRIISVHPETARQIVRFPGFSGDVQTIAFDAITSMYGACHCSSAVVRRIPRRYENTDVARGMPVPAADNGSTHTTSSNGDGAVAAHLGKHSSHTSNSPFQAIPIPGAGRGATTAIDIVNRSSGSLGHGQSGPFPRSSGSFRNNALAVEALNRQFIE